MAHATTAMKATKEWESMTARLAEARRDLYEAEQVVGIRLADNLDTREAQTVVKAMELEVRSLESAVAILWQRQQDEEEAVRQQALTADREQEQAEITTLYEMACAICVWMESGVQLFLNYAAQRKKVIDAGNSAVNAKLHDCNLSFTSFLYRVCGCMASCVNPYRAFQNNEKWNSPWSEMHPKSEMVLAPRIEPPIEKPRKGWQAEG